MSNSSEVKGKVQLSTGTEGEFELTCSVLLLTEDRKDWIDSIHDEEGDDAVQRCKEWAEREGYEIVPDQDEDEEGDRWELMLRSAKSRIAQAEQELGLLLTSGQRRDLLADNFAWTTDEIAEAVRELDEEDAARWRATRRSVEGTNPMRSYAWVDELVKRYYRL